MDRRGAPVQPGDDDQIVAIAATPEDILVTVAGGPAGAFVQVLLPYGGMAERVVRVPSPSPEEVV